MGFNNCYLKNRLPGLSLDHGIWQTTIWLISTTFYKQTNKNLYCWIQCRPNCQCIMQRIWSQAALFYVTYNDTGRWSQLQMAQIKAACYRFPMDVKTMKPDSSLIRNTEELGKLQKIEKGKPVEKYLQVFHSQEDLCSIFKSWSIIVPCATFFVCII